MDTNDSQSHTMEEEDPVWPPCSPPRESNGAIGGKRCLFHGFTQWNCPSCRMWDPETAKDRSQNSDVSPQCDWSDTPVLMTDEARTLPFIPIGQFADSPVELPFGPLADELETQETTLNNDNQGFLDTMGGE